MSRTWASAASDRRTDRRTSLPDPGTGDVTCRRCHAPEGHTDGHQHRRMRAAAPRTGDRRRDRPFESAVAEYLAGDLAEDVFRASRLTQGIYGQRQGGTNQMVRVKVPYGRVEPEQLEMSRRRRPVLAGWGHLTTRQNAQFHFVELPDTPEVLRLLASVGLTSREACGDTVRNVAGCHLAGACPTRCSTSRRGPRPRTGGSSATRSRSGCRGSSRSTSAAARPTAARRCSTTSGSSR